MTITINIRTGKGSPLPEDSEERMDIVRRILRDVAADSLEPVACNLPGPYYAGAGSGDLGSLSIAGDRWDGKP